MYTDQLGCFCSCCMCICSSCTAPRARSIYDGVGGNAFNAFYGAGGRGPAWVLPVEPIGAPFRSRTGKRPLFFKSHQFENAIGLDSWIEMRRPLTSAGHSTLNVVIPCVQLKCTGVPLHNIKASDVAPIATPPLGVMSAEGRTPDDR